MDIVGWLIGFAGIVISVYFYLKSRRRKSLSYKVFNNTIFSSEVQIPDLTVSYKQKKLSAFANAKIIIANTGQGVISQEHLSKAAPLRISVPEKYEILDYSIFFADNHDVIELRRISASEVLIDFEFLNPKEGFIISLLHNAPSSKEIELLGRLENVKELTILKKNSIYGNLKTGLIGLYFLSVIIMYNVKADLDYNLTGTILSIIFLSGLIILETFNERGRFNPAYINDLQRRVEE